MAAAEFDITLYKGTDFSKTLSLTDVNGDTFDLSVYDSVRCDMRRHPALPDVVATFVCDIVGDGSTGQVIWGMDNAITAEIPTYKHYYDMMLYHSDGSIHALLVGEVDVDQNVTQS